MCFSSNASIVVTDPRVPRVHPHITPPRQEWGAEPGYLLKSHVNWHGIIKKSRQKTTLPKTNIAPARRPKPKRKRIFQPLICKGYFSFTEWFNHFSNSNKFQIQIFQMVLTISGPNWCHASKGCISAFHKLLWTTRYSGQSFHKSKKVVFLEQQICTKPQPDSPTPNSWSIRRFRC